MPIMRPNEAVTRLEELTGSPALVSAPKLKRWRSQGRGPDFVRIEGRVFYTEEALLAWLENQGVPLRRRGSTWDCLTSGHKPVARES